MTLRAFLPTILIFASALLTATTANAQTVERPANSVQPPAQTNALTPTEADRVLSVLTDPNQREQLIGTLQAIAKAAPAATAAAQPAAAASHKLAGKPPPPQLSLQPDSLGAQLVVQAAAWAQGFSDEIIAASRALTDIPLVWRGLVALSSNSAVRAEALEAGWRLIFVLACALVVEALLAYALRRPLAALEFERPTGSAEAAQTAPAIGAVDSSPPPSAGEDNWRLTQRLPLALLKLTLWLLPVGAFGATGALLLVTQIGSSDSTRLVIIEALKAYMLCRAIICVARMLASPTNPRLRLLYVGDQTAAYIEVWVRRIAAVTVIGATLAETAQLLGGSEHLHHGLVKTVAFVLILFLLTIVLQCRAAIAAQIRTTDDARGTIAVLRNRLADTWHYIAIFIIVALWLIWAIKVRNGPSRSLQLIVVSIAVVTVARLCAIPALGVLDRLFHVNPDLARRFPGLEERANRYYPLLRAAISLAIGWIMMIALFEVWGVDALAWFKGDAIGGRLVSALVTIAIAAAVSVAVWEGANAAMARHLERLTREARSARSARLRTLLPIFRTSLLIVILVVVGMTVLSEIGVNIAPLLAGAGIVGIAIGFGSQKLVQDFITGLFLLLENAMQVGDWVTVSGLSGSVENLSIRTIRLRAGDGSVHIVPFSSVTSVTNWNRGIGNAAVSVSIAYEEDTDHVGETLRQIAAEMRADARLKSEMLGDLQLWGVDKVDGVSATIVGQIPCTDSGRWEVQREFNRRMKRRFQELGIRIAPPNPSVLIQQTSPPASPDDEAEETPERTLAGLRRGRR